MKDNLIKVIILYFVLMNLISFLLMGIDKNRAKKRAWRVPEATLFLFALFGGSIGSIAGMYTFRHKTKHWYFVVGMPLILILQIIGLFFLLRMPVHVTIL